MTFVLFIRDAFAVGIFDICSFTAQLSRVDRCAPLECKPEVADPACCHR